MWSPSHGNSDGRYCYQGGTKNSREKRIFHQGDVIWVDGGEYMMTAADGSDNDLSVLIIKQWGLFSRTSEYESLQDSEIVTIVCLE